MAGEEIIRVHGIRDLRSALSKIDKELAKELREALAEAADIVLQVARPLVPRRTGAAQASMKVRRTSAAATLVVGGTKAPYFPWLEWGGRIGRKKSIVRPFVPGGRTIYPTLRAKRKEIDAKVDAALERLARAAGFESSGEA